ncbi:MAG: twin-arginine translocase subunit TatC [Nitrospinae bacterium]|nr:twin-arginine translocase subunit TatC [Nitrospinota bacterium]
MMPKPLPRGTRAPLAQHLEELRQRVIVCVLFFIAAFIACYVHSDRLLAPFAGLLSVKLVFLTPLEAFMAYMSVAFYAAAALTVPVFAWHAWAFVLPGLLEHESRKAGRFVIGTVLFFVLGVGFCWYLVLPFAIPFLMAYGGDVMVPMISVKAYLNFCLSMLFVFGAVFELPVIVVFLHGIGLVSLEALKNFRRYWLVAAFIIGAIVTPTPDLLNQAMASVPLIVLYEASILYIYLFGGKKDTEKEKANETNG